MTSKKYPTQSTMLRSVDDQHAPDGKPNWNSRTVYIADCLDVMRQMNSGSVQLIYLDPPFNKNKNFQSPAW